MNIAIDNPSKATQAQKPEQMLITSNDPQDTSNSLNLDHEEIRSLGKELATSNPVQTKKIDEIEKEEKTLTVLNSVVNFARKIGSKALNAGGFVGITMAALSYILFNFRLLSAFFAIPSVGAFFIANTLKKNAKASERELGILSDPTQLIKRAKNDSIFMEENFSKVTAAMVKIGEMKDKDPKKQEALKDLDQVARKIVSKRNEVKAIENTSHELFELNRFLEIYSDIQPDVNESVEIESELSS
jgi:hypothetical protein